MNKQERDKILDGLVKAFIDCSNADCWVGNKATLFRNEARKILDSLIAEEECKQ